MPCAKRSLFGCARRIGTTERTWTFSNGCGSKDTTTQRNTWRSTWRKDRLVNRVRWEGLWLSASVRCVVRLRMCRAPKPATRNTSFAQLAPANIRSALCARLNCVDGEIGYRLWGGSTSISICECGHHYDHHRSSCSAVASALSQGALTSCENRFPRPGATELRSERVAQLFRTVYVKDGTKYEVTRLSDGRTLEITKGSWSWNSSLGKVKSLEDALALIKALSGQEIKSIS